MIKKKPTKLVEVKDDDFNEEIKVDYKPFDKEKYTKVETDESDCHDIEIDFDDVDEVTNLENGTYAGRISSIEQYEHDKFWMRIELDDGVFITFVTMEKLKRYPFNQLFKSVASKRLGDLVGLNIQFDIRNNIKDGIVFSNIIKINVI